MRRLALPVALFLVLAREALAHASEGGFVLLLPTRAYIVAGAATVAVTVLLVSVLPGRAILSLFAARALGRSGPVRGHAMAGLIGFLAVPGLVALGLWGPHDPSRNLLPLTVWTAFWVILPLGQVLFGDLWRHLNPWHWPARMCRRLGLRPRARLPGGMAQGVALASFLAVAVVLLAHPAPNDPDTLAAMVVCYWTAHFIGTLVFGPRWLRRAEGLGQLFAAYAALAPVARQGGRWCIGLPGWRLLHRPVPPTGTALFFLTMLAVGSFDGLNETFLWIGAIGLNPLEFAGRSYAVVPNLVGLVLAVPLLIAVFAAAVVLGARLARAPALPAIRALAPAILPIALAYHVAHYLPSTLIEVQYLLLALNDPLGQGANILGLEHAHVTTGFFSSLATVRMIWLTQAGAVVLGHVLAVLLGHALALRIFGSQRAAALSQLPLALFMVAYTLFGLWLLATPRGV